MNNAVATAAGGRMDGSVSRNPRLTEAGCARLYRVRPYLARTFRLTICPQQSGISNCLGKVGDLRLREYRMRTVFRFALSFRIILKLLINIDKHAKKNKYMYI